MRFFRWLTSANVILKATLFFVVLVFASGIYLTGRELLENQKSYLESLSNQQGYFVDQLQEQMRYMLENGAETPELVQYLSENVQASGKRWVFFAIGNRLVFAKNETTTNDLEELAYWYTFMDYVENQEDMLVKYNTFDYLNKTYRTGLVYSKSAALNEDFISRHNIYTIMVNSIALLALLSLMLGAMISLAGIKKKLRQAEASITEKNAQIESLMESTKNIRSIEMPEEMEANFQKVYDGSFLCEFLERSNDPALFPICFLGISILMGREYFSREQILHYIKPIEGFLSPRYILGEIGRGQFVAILYRTNFAEATKLRDDIYALWKDIHEISGTKVGVGVAQMDHTQGTPIQAYNKFIEEIKKARSTHTN